MGRIIIALLLFSAVLCDGIAQELTFTSIHPVAAVKRGKSYQVNWRGGLLEDAISIALVDKRGREIELDEMENTGLGVVVIPSRTKPGGYSIKIANKNSGEVSSSGQLRVKRRIPLAIQLSPLVLIPIAVLISRQNAGSELEDMPAAPSLPD